jgi:predicted RNase H-like HicB family nuclease
MLGCFRPQFLAATKSSVTIGWQYVSLVPWFTNNKYRFAANDLFLFMFAPNIQTKKMELELTRDFIRIEKRNYIGWIREIKGVVAQGESIAEVKNELKRVLDAKLQRHGANSAKAHPVRKKKF